MFAGHYLSKMIRCNSFGGKGVYGDSLRKSSMSHIPMLEADLLFEALLTSALYDVHTLLGLFAKIGFFSFDSTHKG